jgi:uncharacterized protein
MITVDLIKTLNSQSLRYMLTFYRDTNNNEIDLIIEAGGKIIPVEIKASETMSGDYFNTITWFRGKAKCEQDGVVVYGGNQNQKRLQGRVISWRDVEKIYQK